MKPPWISVLVAMALNSLVHGQKVLFKDDFKGKLGKGWSRIGQHPGAWRVTVAKGIRHPAPR